jgi:acyl carrier protein
VRRLADGNIEFIGRIDGQIKIRGFRVELGEIEKRLLSCSQIKEAVVIAGELAKGNIQLVAYVVPQLAGTALSDGLRKYLSGFLPGYMIPSYFVELDKFPLTSNGKVDRKLLPIPGTFKHYSRESYAAPATDMEKLIADIWKEMLKLEKVGIDDNFFDIGGNSLNILQVSKKLNTVLETPLPVMTMFRYTTIRSLSQFLGEQETRDGLDRKKRAEALKKGKSDRLKRYRKREQRNRSVEIKEIKR